VLMAYMGHVRGTHQCHSLQELHLDGVAEVAGA